MKALAGHAGYTPLGQREGCNSPYSTLACREAIGLPHLKAMQTMEEKTFRHGASLHVQSKRAQRLFHNLTFLLLGLIPLLSIGPAKGQNQGPLLRLEPAEVNLGDIPVAELTDSSGFVLIEVFNDGQKPLILQKVEGCCGTNIESYTKAPILPGKKGEIRVMFRIETRLHSISRTVTIHSNSTGENPVKCAIKGRVVKHSQKGRIPL